jgi:hypothetical protein
MTTPLGFQGRRRVFAGGSVEALPRYRRAAAKASSALSKPTCLPEFSEGPAPENR